MLITADLWWPGTDSCKVCVHIVLCMWNPSNQWFFSNDFDSPQGVLHIFTSRKQLWCISYSTSKCSVHMVFCLVLHWLHWLPECGASHAVCMLFWGLPWLSRPGVGISLWAFSASTLCSWRVMLVLPRPDHVLARYVTHGPAGELLDFRTSDGGCNMLCLLWKWNSLHKKGEQTNKNETSWNSMAGRTNVAVRPWWQSCNKSWHPQQLQHAVVWFLSSIAMEQNPRGGIKQNDNMGQYDG